MNKKNFIIGIIILFLFLVISFFLSRRPSEEIINPPNISDAQTIGTSPRYPTNDTPISFSISSEVMTPPEVLPEYTVTFSDRLIQQIETYASSMGFSTPVRSSALFMEWMNNTGRLLFNNTNFSLSLSQTANTPALYPSTHSAIDSIFTHFPLPSILQIVPGPSQSLINNSDTTENETFVEEYSYTLSGHPVYYSATDLSVFNIKSTATQPFKSVAFQIPPESITSLENKTLFNKNQIPELLEQNKGILQSVTSLNTQQVFGIDPNFTSVEIQSLSVAYLLLPEEKRLVPVYILDGLGTGAGEVQQVRYVLRASI